MFLADGIISPPEDWAAGQYLRTTVIMNILLIFWLGWLNDII